MKHHTRHHPPEDTEALALRLGQALKTAHAQDLPADITARLSAMRLQALAAHRQAQQQATHAHTPAKQRRTIRFTWWQRLLAALPIAAAGATAAFMQGAVSDDGLTSHIEQDIQILSSEVPPQAWTDPGFVEFLKAYQPPQTETGHNQPSPSR
ncbi:Protein of unknown function [Lampropedia hyalina DSM 16112]|jgi:hypothetical protein|uniref:DUF3619 family protein n=1 Tax=Lampropedia hyalina DSM 16112 TaxID=1122156 RepID=A0A1M5A9J5_9BURK|nr:DUF3619 family protein [Lampropedia hyalina]SHF26990.1 Protein of unknown function [Lampropedia hyalina DSM 16112]